MVVDSRSPQLGEGGSMLPSSIIFKRVSGIVREGEGLPCTMGWGYPDSFCSYVIRLCVCLYVGGMF
jgi:hypothetical protein